MALAQSVTHNGPRASPNENDEKIKLTGKVGNAQGNVCTCHSQKHFIYNKQVMFYKDRGERVGEKRGERGRGKKEMGSREGSSFSNLREE